MKRIALIAVAVILLALGGAAWWAVNSLDHLVKSALEHYGPQVLGVTLIHGRLLPVVSLEQLLPSNASNSAVATLPRLVVVETLEAEAAIVADEVHGIVEFAAESLNEQAPLAVRPAWVVAEITWEARLLCILHPQRLITAVLGDEESPP